MKQLLSGCNIVITGDFGPARTHQNLKRWIELHGGTVAHAISPKVTHLICSKEHWKRESTVVQAALKHKSIKIVSYDWLEDTLLHRSLRAVRHYLWCNLVKEKKVKRREKKKEVRKLVNEAGPTFKAGCESAQADILSDNHHLYRDSTGFVYNITLCRPDVERNRNERYRLSLYECNAAPPHLYACAATYKVPGKAAVTHILAEPGSQYDKAFLVWRHFFKSKTGVDWDYRFYGQQQQNLKQHEKLELFKLGGADAIGMVNELTHDEVDEGKRKKYFVYTLPDIANDEPTGEIGLKTQAQDRFGEPPELWQVGGEPSESEDSE